MARAVSRTAEDRKPKIEDDAPEYIDISSSDSDSGLPARRNAALFQPDSDSDSDSSSDSAIEVTSRRYIQDEAADSDSDAENVNDESADVNISDDDSEDEMQLEQATQRTAPRMSPSAAPPGRDPVLLALLSDRTPEQPDQSPFNSLPREIKYIFLSYLDRDPYSVYVLSMVSRSWYKTLNQDSSTDVDWQRRCSVMGVQRRSPHCKTWRETFVRQLQKRCLCCFKICNTAFGYLLPGQPDWISVCPPCQVEPGPWQTIPEDECRRRNPKQNLENLPYRVVKNTTPTTDLGKQLLRRRKAYLKYYLASSIEGDPYDAIPKLELHAKKALDKLRKDLASVGLSEHIKQEDLNTLYEYVAQVKHDKTLLSVRLINMITAIYRWEMRTKPIHELVHEALDYLRRLQDFERNEHARLREEQPHLFTNRNPAFLQGMGSDKHRVSLLDSILTGKKPKSRYRELLEELYAKEQAKKQNKIAKRNAKLEQQRDQEINKHGKVLSKNKRKLNGEAKALQKEEKRLARRGAALETPSAASVRASRTSQKRKAEDDESASAPNSSTNSGKRPKNAPALLQCRVGCNNPASGKCAFKRCGKCCTGPCSKHKLPQSKIAKAKAEPKD